MHWLCVARHICIGTKKRSTNSKLQKKKGLAILSVLFSLICVWLNWASSLHNATSWLPLDSVITVLSMKEVSYLVLKWHPNGSSYLIHYICSQEMWHHHWDFKNFCVSWEVSKQHRSQNRYDDTNVSTQLKRKEKQPGGAPLVLFTLYLNSSFDMLWLSVCIYTQTDI